MSVRVKICGTTSLEDGRVAAEAGAEMLGFIFYEKSPRAVTPEQVAQIVAELRDEFDPAAPRMVGIFVDDSVARVRDIMAQAGLDLAQLHGSEPPAEIKALHPLAFKAIRPQTRGDAEAMVATYSNTLPDNPDAPDFLLDAYHAWKMGGTGETANWMIAQVIARRFKLLLAGGLTPDTVAEAIRTVQPWGVDVVSGVEAAPGVKDHEKVRAFVRQVKRQKSKGKRQK